MAIAKNRSPVASPARKKARTDDKAIANNPSPVAGSEIVPMQQPSCTQTEAPVVRDPPILPTSRQAILKRDVDNLMREVVEYTRQAVVIHITADGFLKTQLPQN